MCICVYTHVLVQLKAPSKSKQTKPNNNKKAHNILQLKKQRMLAHGEEPEVKAKHFSLLIQDILWEEWAAGRALALQTGIEMSVSS